MSTPLLLVLCAQFANPGAYTSEEPAGQTSGPNVLFFGNSFTISSANPAVNTPSYGGARGVPELVRRVAIAAGRDAPFVKNVYHLNRGLDYHLNLANPSLAEIDEAKLEGERWDFVVLQGFSTRPTEHPYTGNRAKLKANGLQLFEEVRAGTTNHALQSPDVVPVLYQTWARSSDHWFYDTSSANTAGANIPAGTAAWTGSALFTSPAEMAAQVRTGYAALADHFAAGVPGAFAPIARVGDAWEAAGFGPPGIDLYAADRYHASSHGDLLTAFTLYGTLWSDANTCAVVQSGALDGTLTAIGVTPLEAAVLAAAADAVLSAPPVALPEEPPPAAVLFDFSTAAGQPVGAEVLPWPGRHYNVVGDHVAGAVSNAVDTRGRPTGIGLAIVDAFAGEGAGGANGAWIGAVGLSGSLYAEAAQLDSFFVGRGFGFQDDTARLVLSGLDPRWRYELRCHGSRNSSAASRVGIYAAAGRVATLDAYENLNLVADLLDVAPDLAGRVELLVTSGAEDLRFAYLNVLELRRFRPVHFAVPPVSR